MPSTTRAYFTVTATTSFTAQGAWDKGSYPEEPREGKALTRGSGVRVSTSKAFAGNCYFNVNANLLAGSATIRNQKQ
jgi:hypothetical protein